jgi:hypothetical protein
VPSAQDPNKNSGASPAEVIPVEVLPPEWGFQRTPAKISALTAFGEVRAARLGNEIAEEERKAAELARLIRIAETEADKIYAETVAVCVQLGLRVKQLRKEIEAVITDINIETATRGDKVAAAKARAKRERVLAEAELRMARSEVLLQRTERSAQLRELRRRRQSTGAEAAQADLAQWAEVVAAEAAEDNLEAPATGAYVEFAAFHYVCARLRGEKHGDAIASVARLLVNRRLSARIEEGDTTVRDYYRRRYKTVSPAWHTHRGKLRDAEVQAVLDDAAKERALHEAELAALKLRTVEHELELARLHHNAAEVGGDTVYDRES